MSLRLQPVRVETGSGDEDGRLVFRDDALIALLVRLSDNHDADSGKWFLEAGFGCVAQERNPLFEDLEQAQAWFATR
ncbi:MULTISPECIES: hypothetical protein [Methylobacterium]|uniref:STAS/SEC14 domain-containing protein n=1 Tax=Methylobacterium hispanicum TaxID=270350 RepID=A0AAV4ZMC3_9HYPH|nr:hypothetical protein [Methylobacterium hispanicum]GJD89296.1 hypothetical protein BHAOGJBA_2822 [Methylobacterium hispanicum]